MSKSYIWISLSNQLSCQGIHWGKKRKLLTFNVFVTWICFQKSTWFLEKLSFIFLVHCILTNISPCVSSCVYVQKFKSQNCLKMCKCPNFFLLKLSDKLTWQWFWFPWFWFWRCSLGHLLRDWSVSLCWLSKQILIGVGWKN